MAKNEKKKQTLIRYTAEGVKGAFPELIGYRIIFAQATDKHLFTQIYQLIKNESFHTVTKNKMIKNSV